MSVQHCLRNGNFDEFGNPNYFFQCTYSRTLISDEHYHDFYEIVYVYSGGCVQVINSVPQSFSAGDITMLCPGTAHYFKDQQPNTSVISLSIKKEEMERFIYPYARDEHFIKNDAPITVHLDLSEQRNIQNAYLPIISAPQELQEAYCKILLGVAVPLFYSKFIIRSDNKSGAPQAFTLLLSAMMEPENIKKGIDAMIEISNFSHSHLCRIFKQYMNVSPHQYITSLRMNYAFDLVTSSDMPFENIAESIGYASFSHFSHKFKDTYRKTPANMRKLYKNRTV